MNLQEVIAEIVSQSDKETDADELADKLTFLAENPVQVNQATEEELDQLFWLNEFQVQNLKNYITIHGFIATIYELTYISGFTEKDARLLAPFISFAMAIKEIPIHPSRILSDSRHRLLIRSQYTLEKQKGYNTRDSVRFAGKPGSSYLRYTFQYKDRISAGFTGEKDAGEEFFTGSNKKGFDFNSFYFQVNRLRFIKTIVVGDYRVYFGQGLAVWSGFNFGKSSAIMNSLQRNCGITRYQSADENRFFRGAAVTLGIKPIELSLWYSSHAVDANVTSRDSLSGKVTEVSSLGSTGVHALPSEINDKGALRANVIGSHITLIKPGFNAGITALYYSYPAYVNPTYGLYNQYYFRGNSNYNLSMDWRYRIKNVIVFGEEALSQSGGMALLNGFQASVSSRFNLSIVHRYYQRNYQAMYGNAFGENSQNANEEGLFAGFELKPFKYTVFSGYVDVFHFPWLTYGADMPAVGRDFCMQVALNPSDRVQMSVQYRDKSKESNYTEANAAKSLIDYVNIQRWRYSLSYSANEFIQLKNRLEWSHYGSEFSEPGRGFMISQDAEICLAKMPIKFYMHYAMFDIDDYNSRIYMYENDLLYTFSIPAFYDKGYRAYLMCKYSPTRHIDVWVKYAITQYADKKTIGSGPYEIEGDHKSEIKMQILFKL